MVQFGVCVPAAKSGPVAEAGFDYFEANAVSTLDPTLSDEQWAETAAGVGAAAIPLGACNLFFPGGMPLVGPERDLARITDYADRLLERLAKVGGRVQVFGSGKARTPSPDYDLNRALDELKELASRLGPIAQRHGVVIAMEHLRAVESSLLTTLEAARAFVLEVDHPAIRLLVDSYHMAQMEEPWESIRACKGLLVHAHTADPVTRHEPSRAPADLRPFLRELAAIGYEGGVSVECAWQDFENSLGPTHDLLVSQWHEVSRSK